MQELTSDLVKLAKGKLADGTVKSVIGWRRGLFDDDITPSVFTTAEDLEKNFVFNKFCKANLSKYLVKHTRGIEIKKSTTRTNNVMAKQRDPNAQDAPIPEEKVLVFLKPGDTHSFTQLLKENRITRDDVYVVAIPCACTLDEAVPAGEGCDHCRNKKHVTYDEVFKAHEQHDDPARFAEVEKLEHMTAAERYDFWRNEFSRCIRCNACRDVCPACTCEKCVFDNTLMYTSQKVAANDFEESLYHIIRAWHVAGRCTDCGECSRVCPEHIPLHLLNRKFVKDINELYGDYVAGSDMETKPPMLTYTFGDAEASVVYQRDPNSQEAK